MRFILKEDTSSPIKITGYHGSQNPDIKLKSKPFYLSDDRPYGENVALGYLFDYDLMDDEVPTLYTFEATFNNPYYCSEEDWEEIGDSTVIEETIPELEKQGYDGIITDKMNGVAFYIVFDALRQLRLIDKETVDDDKRWY